MRIWQLLTMNIRVREFNRYNLLCSHYGLVSHKVRLESRLQRVSFCFAHLVFAWSRRRKDVVIYYTFLFNSISRVTFYCNYYIILWLKKNFKMIFKFLNTCAIPMGFDDSSSSTVFIPVINIHSTPNENINYGKKWFTIK